MVFAPKSPKLDSEESQHSSFVPHADEEKQQASLYTLPEKNVDAFEALRHSFRPKDEFSENMQVLVKNMAEPMIRDWLEKHMMGIVENLVRAEIERVTRGTSSS